MPSIDRRTVLAALATGLAGCSSSCPDSDPPEPDSVLRSTDAGDGFRTLPGGSWPTPRADSANTGYAPGTAPTSPSVRWRRRLPAPAAAESSQRASSPVVADDRVFVVTGAGAFALSLRDGTERWHRSEVEPAVVDDATVDERIVPPVVGDGRVYVATTDGVAALRPDDGSVAWRYGTTPTGAPAVVGDGVVFPTSDGVAAVAADGSERWTAGTEAWGLPAVADGTVVVAGDGLAAFDAATGTRRWRSDVRPEGPPVVADGAVVVGTYSELRAIDLADAGDRWAVDRGGGRAFSAPVVTPDTIYAVEQPGEASDATFALDRTDGAPEPRWCSYAGEGAVTAATDDHAIARQSIEDARTDGLVAFTHRFGEATWGYAPTDRPLAPAVLDGAVVAVDGTGGVVALGDGEGGA